MRSHAFAEIHKLVMENPLKVKQSAFTRWLSHDLAVKSIVKSYEALVIHLDEICASSNPRVNTMSSPTADAISKGLRKYSSACILLFLHDCLPVLSRLSLKFQRRDIDLIIIEPTLQNTLSALDKLKTTKGPNSARLPDLCNAVNISFTCDNML